MSTLAALHDAVDVTPFHHFVRVFTDLVDDRSSAARLPAAGAVALARLVADDRWLPDDYAEAGTARYRQYLLHLDPAGRFSVVSFVWGPGQSTPIHDHRVWGLVGVLRGAERIERFDRQADGAFATLGSVELAAGAIDLFGPGLGDYHRVANAAPGRVSVSIHVYGGDIGTIERATYSPDGEAQRFVSGYANGDLPPLSLGAL